MTTTGATVARHRPERRRRRLQFSLRSLFVFMLLVGIGMSWLAVRMERARKQREAVGAIRQAGGYVCYDYQIQRADAPQPLWPLSLAGEDFFSKVVLVNFADRRITDSDLERLKGLRHVTSLFLNRTNIADGSLGHLEAMKQLESLDVFDTGITDVGLNHLRGLDRLQTLDLGFTEITDAGLETITGLNRLEELSLNGTDITDAGLERLKGLARLQRLLLNGTKVTDAGLRHLKELPGLRKLTIGSTKVTEEGAAALQQALPNCEIERHWMVLRAK